MIKAHKYIVKRHFQGIPIREDYEVIEYNPLPLKDGEALLKSEWISVDPYLRYRNSYYTVPYDQFSFQVGVVIDSKSVDYPIGSRVVSKNGWTDYSIVKAESPVNHMSHYKIPILEGLSPSLAVGAVGMPGATAYFGFFEICQPKTGETVVVTAAAGAVGSLVGQFAKIKGCKIIGFTGSNDKVRWLEEELGFDKALNYKNIDVAAALREAAPEGIDCYFDNVGGEISSVIISQMKSLGRIAVCGAISTYNDDISRLPQASSLQYFFMDRQLKMEGFIVSRWVERWPEAFEQIVKWIKSGKLKIKEHITEGFDNLFEAFINMLSGENIGKAVVKV